MQTLTIGYNESGQRLDKFLAKYLSLAHKNYIYKLLRTKYITLNAKKAMGSEIISLNDNIRIYLSDETIEGLIETKSPQSTPDVTSGRALDIVYEDTDIMLINKSAGVLSQRAARSDTSLVEMIAAHLQGTGELDDCSGRAFAPSVANRLDRNTSGLVAAGKTLHGLQTLSAMIVERRIEKYYLCLVVGAFTRGGMVSVVIEKDEAANRSAINVADDHGTLENGSCACAHHMSMHLEPLAHSPDGRPDTYTLVRVKLETGKSHQIRAYMAHIGHPIVGDPKYGEPRANAYFKKTCALHRQDSDRTRAAGFRKSVRGGRSQGQ